MICAGYRTVIGDGTLLRRKPDIIVGAAMPTWASGTTRSAGFMRDFSSVVPSLACKARACLHV